MFDSLLTSGHYDASCEALVTPDEAVFWNQFSPVVDRLYGELADLAGTRVALQFRASGTCLALLAVLDRLKCDTILLSDELRQDAAEALVEPFRVAALMREFVSPDTVEPWPHFQVQRTANGQVGVNEYGVTILTSGTSGRPKAVRHSWESLARPVRRSPVDLPPRWLLSYAPHLYAGLQVILQSLINHGCLVSPLPSSTPDEVIHLMSRGKVAYASATPSYWRRLLLFANRSLLAGIPLRVVTLGGEPVDQSILTQLAQLFPNARLVHIYATTELGRCFSVTDGRAGFPTTYLEKISSDGVELRIHEGELWVRSANRMNGYVDQPDAKLDEWISTGDLTETRGDRVFFVGRKSEIINVGGNKVHPYEVERVIREFPDVVDVRVYGKSSSIAGELVSCEIIVANGADAVAVKRSVTTKCVELLTEFQRPRVIEVVSMIPLSSAGKTRRSAE